ncbi:hypothetical protein MA16_Dca026678 [Dendrobium catenatum]|uniref:Uncharacterized protein n=1 Tax=Dendrobium catenatum TaxID=906689 RepID=A0A2I0VAA4_9ASPA|nr:hypothetical protein MA16_Dca026678 [Dendrobium catenatum]
MEQEDRLVASVFGFRSSRTAHEARLCVQPQKLWLGTRSPCSSLRLCARSGGDTRKGDGTCEGQLLIQKRSELCPRLPIWTQGVTQLLWSMKSVWGSRLDIHVERAHTDGVDLSFRLMA